jgi:magnesium transporter
MPNLPKPRLRRPGRRGELVSQPAAPEPQKPNVEEIESNGLRWVNIEWPGSLERTWLEEHFDFHALDLEDVLSRNQRPKIDVYDDYLFIVLHLPVFDPAAGRLNAGELDLFVGPDYVVTIPNQPLQPVEYLFERCRAKEELREQLFSRGSGYLLYRLVDDSFDYCFPMLRKIGNKLDALEETNESVISHRLNDILRVLTSISVVILPLTLIASVMGMNTWVPDEHNQAGFFVVLGVMALVLIGLVAYFRKRRWL